MKRYEPDQVLHRKYSAPLPLREGRGEGENGWGLKGYLALAQLYYLVCLIARTFYDFASLLGVFPITRSDNDSLPRYILLHICHNTSFRRFCVVCHNHHKYIWMSDGTISPDCNKCLQTLYRAWYRVLYSACHGCFYMNCICIYGGMVYTYSRNDFHA